MSLDISVACDRGLVEDRYDWNIDCVFVLRNISSNSMGEIGVFMVAIVVVTIVSISELA